MKRFADKPLNRSGEAELGRLVSPHAFSIMRIQAIDLLNIVLLSGGRGGGNSILLVWLIIYLATINGKGEPMPCPLARIVGM
jgi:hypothetical protein